MQPQPLHTLTSAIAYLRDACVPIQLVSDGCETIRASDAAKWDDGGKFALRYAPNSEHTPIRIGDWCLVEWDRRANRPVRLTSGKEFVVYVLS